MRLLRANETVSTHLAGASSVCDSSSQLAMMSRSVSCAPLLLREEKAEARMCELRPRIMCQHARGATNAQRHAVQQHLGRGAARKGGAADVQGASGVVDAGTCARVAGAAAAHLQPLRRNELRQGAHEGVGGLLKHCECAAARQRSVVCKRRRAEAARALHVRLPRQPASSEAAFTMAWIASCASRSACGVRASVGARRSAEASTNGPSCSTWTFRQARASGRAASPPAPRVRYTPRTAPASRCVVRRGAAGRASVGRGNEASEARRTSALPPPAELGQPAPG